MILFAASQLKWVADLLTCIRMVLAFMLLIVGMIKGQSGFQDALILLILAWATDLTDGPLARRASDARSTWIGDHDLAADVSVSVGCLGYLVLSEYVGIVPAGSYVLLFGVLIGYYRSKYLGWACQALPYGAMIWFGFREVPFYAYLTAGWILFTIVITWPRFPRQALEFLRGMRDLAPPTPR